MTVTTTHPGTASYDSLEALAVADAAKIRVSIAGDFIRWRAAATVDALPRGM
jgi:hypothetical protein